MSTPYLGQIIMVGFNFPPKGFATCDGQLLAINQNQALFSILGTTYGGDGRTTFALPDLRTRTPIHVGTQGGTSYQLGQRAGEEQHTLASFETPAHTHNFNTSGNPATLQRVDPNNASVIASGDVQLYAQSGSAQVMSPGVISTVGGSQPHNNMQPCLTINFCIALTGVFPSPN